MSRVLATLVSVAMLATSGLAIGQHVHAYSDHDHAEHHHGPAAHQHLDVAHHHASDASSSAASMEGCDPGAHAVPVVFTYVAPHQPRTPMPATIETFAFVLAVIESRPAPPADLRTHSPPRITDAPRRGPPLVNTPA